jgi:hypothetical protein
MEDEAVGYTAYMRKVRHCVHGTVSLEKLIVTHLSRIIPAFYGNQTFIAMFIEPATGKPLKENKFQIVFINEISLINMH